MLHKTGSAKTYLKDIFGKDLMASVVVFLVALPLCMGIAIASGVPPALGIITGIVGGLVVGTLAGSPFQVSGPAAGLTVLVWQFVQEFGISQLGIVVLIAGFIQILAGLLKVGQWFRAISPAVIQGMLAGIGILIIGSQTHVMVDDSPKGSGWTNLISIPLALWKGVVPMDGTTHHIAAYIGLLTIIVMVAWKFAPQRLKIIPAPLLAVAISTIVAGVLQLPIYYVSVSGNLMNDVQWLSGGSVSGILNPSILMAGVAIALIASAETLLCATAVDQLHQGTRTNYDRELFAQGVGNALCGVLGALPMTGVIVRSSANIEAGARTRGSAILHGLWLLAAVSMFPFLLNKIPTTSLAAILVFTGFKLVSPKAVRSLSKYGRSEVLIYAATVVTIVGTDLLKGVLFGLALSLAKLIYTFSHLELRLEKDQPREGQMTLVMKGAATFIRLPKLAATLESVQVTTHLHIVMEQLDYIDHACIDLLANWEKQHAATGGEIIMEWDVLHRKYFERSPSVLTALASENEVSVFAPTNGSSS
jgi:MFS superfamily sulfate permease-like transporter